jgi:ketosteroid isomerase-like protein
MQQIASSNGSWALDDARAFLARAEEAFRTGDREAVLDLFDEDVHVVWADFPPMRGKDEYRRFLDARFARQRHYTPTTTVRTVVGSVVGASWEATWIDAQTGVEMYGRGCEFLTLRDGVIVDYVVSFNAWDPAAGPATPIV